MEFQLWFVAMCKRLKDGNKGGRGRSAPSYAVRVPVNCFDDLNNWKQSWEATVAQGRGPRYDVARKMLSELDELMWAPVNALADAADCAQSQGGNEVDSEAGLDELTVK